jgi:hypothetical protein
MSSIFPVKVESVERYEGVVSVFVALYAEIKELGKKKPETTLSAFKVRQVNRVLTDVRSAVEEEPEAKYLELLDDAALPQYGDAILLMAQFDGALKAFKNRHHGYQSALHESDWLYLEEKRRSRAKQ